MLSIAKTADAAPGLGDGPTEYDPVELTASTAAATETGGSTAVLSPTDLDAIAATDGILDVNPVIAVTPSWIEYDGNGRYNLAVGANSEMTRADLASGTQLSQSSDANEVLLPASYLTNLGFDDAENAVGATITLTGIIGVLNGFAGSTPCSAPKRSSSASSAAPSAPSLPSSREPSSAPSCPTPSWPTWKDCR